MPHVLTERNLRVGLVGCGLIGRRRGRVVRESGQGVLVAVSDINPAASDSVALELNCARETDWNALIAREDIDAIIVSTPNKFLVPIATAALQRGKHVLCEKPPGRNLQEAETLAETARASKLIVKVGFNHRHHPALWRAHEMSSRGDIGPLMFLRAVYGHGGRPGYDKEWRGSVDLAGGGELLDQGVHLADLCAWFFGKFDEAFGYTTTSFWDLGDLEDNAFVTLRTKEGQVAQFHTSWTQWKNRFSFEIFGRNGFLSIEGLGGSYGTETLTVGHRLAESGPPITERFEFSGPDLSWHAEWDEFIKAVVENRQPLANGDEAREAMRIIAAVYESARTGKPVSLR